MWPEPIGEPQKSIEDTWACSNFATAHVIESQIKAQTGKTVNISERFLAIMSGTIPGSGNYLHKVFEVIETIGWVENTDCPHPTGAWTNAEYYSFPITPELLAKANKNRDEWKITGMSLSKPASEMLPKLKDAPLIAFVPKGDPNHFVEVLDEATRFDSYVPYVRPLGLVQNFSQIIIKRKESMKLGNNNGTYYLQGNKGWFGISGVEFLNLILRITDEVFNGPPVGSQLGVVETANDLFLIKDN